MMFELMCNDVWINVNYVGLVNYAGLLNCLVPWQKRVDPFPWQNDSKEPVDAGLSSIS